MLPHPKLSVIIPAYNEEKFLPQCLDAILNQKTKVPYEIIVVDNNSVDRTYTIAKKYRKVKVLLQKTPGAAAARNKGARAAKATILIFIDADCIPRNDYVQQVYDIITTHSVDVITGPYVIYDANNLIRWISDEGNYMYWYSRCMKAMWGFSNIVGGNFAIKKTAYNKVKGFNEHIKDVVIPDDLDFSIRLKQLNFEIQHVKDLKMPSSFRRTSKSPYDVVRRAKYAWSMLAALKLGMQNS